MAKRGQYDVPEVPLPEKYKNADVVPAAVPVDGVAAVSADAAAKAVDADPEGVLIEWWRSFGSPELAALIDRGTANNHDVRIATLRLVQAREQARQAAAGAMPVFSTQLLSGSQAPGGTVGTVPVEGNSGQIQRSYQASLRGAWQVDIWGERSAVTEAARLAVWQSAFDRDNIQRNMVANLASAYVEYLSLNDRLRIARETETVLTGMLTTIEKRLEAGDATLLEMEQQRAAIFATRATIPSLEQQREDVVSSIAFLVGTVPGSLNLSDQGLDSLSLPSVVPGLPSSLLLRRPDVRVAEARLLASDANIDAARARILPPLDLSSQIGYSSLFLSQLFQPKTLFWNAVTSLSATIFDGGKRFSEKDQAKAAHEEMVENYVRTIYQSMREVESALATIRLAGKRLDAQQEATLSAKRAWEISNSVYLTGSVDFLSLLDTERTYYRYLDDFQRIRADQYRGYVSLFQALGGGVNVAQALPGKGKRPDLGRGSIRVASNAPAGKPFNADGVDWVLPRKDGDGGGWHVENFWQVELQGLYHRAAIGSAWRDLRVRYPEVMAGRVILPRLSGRVEDSADGQVAWFRLYVAKFVTVSAAHEFCANLQLNQQRCRVVSSRSDDTVPPPVAEKKLASKTLAVEAPKVVVPKEPKLETVVSIAPLPPPPPKLAEVIEPIPARVERVESVTVPAKKAEAEIEPAEKAREKVAFAVQLGAFSNLENAVIAQAFWLFKGYEAYISEAKEGDGRLWYVVRTGAFAQRREAASLAQGMKRKDDASAVLVPIMVDRSGRPAMLDAAFVQQKLAQQIVVVPEPPEAPSPVAEKAPEPSTAIKPVTINQREKTAYAVQLGAFSGTENAGVSLLFWREKGYKVYTVEILDANGRVWYGVRTGIYASRKEAATMALALGRREDITAAVVSAALAADGKPLSVELPARQIKALEATVPPVATSNEPPSASPVAETSADEPAVKPAPTTAAVVKKAFKPAFTIQLGAYSSIENAAQAKARWREQGVEAYVCEMTDVRGVLRFAVRTGEFAKRREATGLLRELSKRGVGRPVLVPAIVNAEGHLASIDVSGLLSGNSQ